MVRSRKGIEMLVNLVNITYCAMKLLPYQEETFSKYRAASVQEFRFAFQLGFFLPCTGQLQLFRGHCAEEQPSAAGTLFRGGYICKDFLFWPHRECTVGFRPLRPPATADGKKGTACIAWEKLSIQDDFTLSDEKIGGYYMAVRRVLTNIFGKKEVLAYVTFILIIHKYFKTTPLYNFINDTLVSE